MVVFTRNILIYCDYANDYGDLHLLLLFMQLNRSIRSKVNIFPKRGKMKRRFQHLNLERMLMVFTTDIYF